MSRYTDRADELLDLSREAFAGGELFEAKALLRQASSLAPMRQDIRDFLAYVLEQTEEQPLDAPALGESPFDISSAGEIESEPYAAELAMDDVQLPEIDFRASEPHKPKNSILNSFWFSLKNCMEKLTISDDEPDSEPSESEPNAPELPPRPRARMREAIVASSPRTEYEQPQPSATFDMNPERRRISRLPEREDAVTAAARIASRSLRAEKPIAVAPEPPIVTDPEEVLPPYDFSAALKALWRPSPQVVAYSCVYGVMLLFVSIASGSCYYKFFHNRSDGTQIIASPTESVTIPKSPQSGSHTEEQIVSLGTDYISRKRFDDAILLLSAAAKSNSVTAMHDKIATQLGKAYDLKGTDQLKANKITESIDSYKKAVEYLPSDSNVAMHLGNAYYWRAQPLGDKGRDYLVKAVPTLTRAIELDPNNLHAYERLASVQESLAQNNSARETWMKIRRIAPDSEEAIRAAERLKTLSMAN